MSMPTRSRRSSRSRPRARASTKSRRNQARHPVTPAKAVYTASNKQVTLTSRGMLNLTKPEELIVGAAP